MHIWCRSIDGTLNSGGRGRGGGSWERHLTSSLKDKLGVQTQKMKASPGEEWEVGCELQRQDFSCPEETLSRSLRGGSAPSRSGMTGAPMCPRSHGCPHWGWLLAAGDWLGGHCRSLPRAGARARGWPQEGMRGRSQKPPAQILQGEQAESTQTGSWPSSHQARQPGLLRFLE